ncbi:hypothetical protein V6C17_03060 [Dendrosporobacter sp. 1207_IL3150]
MVCPLCNALQPLDKICPICNQQMTDGGAIENYYGPYSPYMSRDSIYGPYQTPVKQCVHLLYCPNCHYDLRVALEMVNI